jgi:two-component system OmpR family sensor kinase
VFRSIPLRVKLVAAVLALVAAALVVICAGSSYFLRSYLTWRVDDELTSYLGSVEQAAPESHPDGLRSNFLVARIHPGVPFADITCDARFQRTDLPGEITSEAWYEARAGRQPFTVMSGSKGMRWRMVVAEVEPGGYAAVAQSLSDVDYAVDRLVRIDLVAGGGVLLLLAVAGAAVVRRSLRPLNEIERTAGAIAAGDLTRRVPDPEPGVAEPGTELGRLSRALNAMLAQIESAFAAREASESAARDAEHAARRSEERMRQFVADASHELRTPLTTIRGFAELYRQLTAAADEQQGRIVRRIEDEAARMGLLVEDLLLLARLDQERPLTLAPVDLRVLAADTVHAARASAPSRDIRMTVEPGTGPLVVEGDDARLRQVLGNLLGNAVNHTPSAAAISVALSAEGDTAVAEVRDTGPGLAPDQVERVFQRFYRADPSRTRPDGSTSTGLGLAIVAALVAAHGGTVEVDSEQGRGATFRVRLPLLPRREVTPTPEPR